MGPITVRLFELPRYRTNSPANSLLPDTAAKPEPSRLLAHPGVIRPLLILALPVLLEELLNLAVSYTDLLLTSRYLHDDESKAAMGLMAYVLWLLPSLFASLYIGGTALVARLYGQGDQRTANRAMHQAFVMGIGFSLVIVLAMWLFDEQFIALMGLKGRSAQLAHQYAQILIPAIPLLMIEQVGIGCLHGAGDTLAGFIAKACVAIINAGLSFALVTGFAFFPDLGFRGLAIGTAAGHATAGLVILFVLLRGRAGLRLGSAPFQIDRDLMARILKPGIPGGIDAIATLSCHLTYVGIINSISLRSAAAHAVAVTIEALSYLPGSAFQVAAASLAGQCLGAGDPRRAQRGALVAAGLAATVMGMAALTFFFLGRELAAVFTGDFNHPTTILAGELLAIVAISTPFLAILQVFNGALRGAGDTRFPLLVAFIGLAIVRIPLAMYFAWEAIDIPAIGIHIKGLGLGAQGAWWAMCIDVAVRATLISARFFQGGWKKVEV
jgi:putative MATE family efflux protein